MLRKDWSVKSIIIDYNDSSISKSESIQYRITQNLSSYSFAYVKLIENYYESGTTFYDNYNALKMIISKSDSDSYDTITSNANMIANLMLVGKNGNSNPSNNYGYVNIAKYIQSYPSAKQIVLYASVGGWNQHGGIKAEVILV